MTSGMKPLTLFSTLALTVSLLLPSESLLAQSGLKARIDSLFIIASSGEVRYRDQNEPAMDSIAALGAQAVPYLIDKFVTKSARERWTIIWTLERLGSEAVPDLVNALHGRSALVTGRVAWALGNIGDSTATDPLMEIARHSSWLVRDRSITALGKIGEVSAAPVVIAALSDSVGQVRKSAVVSSGRLVLVESIPELVHLLGDRFYGARLGAVESLMKLDSTLIVATLVDSIESFNRMVGHLACEVFSRLSTDETHDLLLQQTHSADPLRRAHAAVGLVWADPLDNCGFLPGFLEAETDRLTRLKVESAVVAAKEAIGGI